MLEEQIKSLKTIIDQKGNCSKPIGVHCCCCPLYKRICSNGAPDIDTILIEAIKCLADSKLVVIEMQVILAIRLATAYFKRNPDEVMDASITKIASGLIGEDRIFIDALRNKVFENKPNMGATTEEIIDMMSKSGLLGEDKGE